VLKILINFPFGLSQGYFSGKFFPSFQSEKSDFDLLTPSIFYDKTKYSSNPKPFALCRNVNGVRLICCNWALGESKHFEKQNAYKGRWVFPLTLSPWG
jgi:hypothetical protein